MISPLIIEEIMHIIVIANRARQDLIVATNLWLTTNLTGTFYKIRNYIKLDDDANAKELHLVFIGAGLQTELHIRYLYHLPIMKKLLKRVTIVNRSLGRAESLKESIKMFLNDDMDDNHTIDDDNENISKSDQEN